MSYYTMQNAQHRPRSTTFHASIAIIRTTSKHLEAAGGHIWRKGVILYQILAIVPLSASAFRQHDSPVVVSASYRRYISGNSISFKSPLRSAPFCRCRFYDGGRHLPRIIVKMIRTDSRPLKLIMYRKEAAGLEKHKLSPCAQPMQGNAGEGFQTSNSNF